MIGFGWAGKLAGWAMIDDDDMDDEVGMMGMGMERPDWGSKGGLWFGMHAWFLIVYENVWAG
jgi:hypothetical protein